MFTHAMAAIGKKKVIVIVPTPDSVELYKPYISKYDGTDVAVNYYESFAAFSLDMPFIRSFAGFIVDLRCIIKADEGDKEFFYYLLDTFPVIRLSHSKDKKTITGNIKGKTLHDEKLFSYFFEDILRAGRDNPGRQIVMFVNNEESKDLYLSLLTGEDDLVVEWSLSAEQFRKSLDKKKLYCGFIIDLRTMMKSTPEDKEFLYELLESFPSMRISHTADKITVKGNVRDKSFQNKDLIDAFLDSCRYFTPRGIRTQNRKPLFLNVLIDPAQEKKSKQNRKVDMGVRTNTTNISEEGAFIVSTPQFDKSDTLNIIIHELSDHSPINCTVKWILPWGNTIKHLPGIGISLNNLKPGQKKEILELLE